MSQASAARARHKPAGKARTRLSSVGNAMPLPGKKRA